MSFSMKLLLGVVIGAALSIPQIKKLLSMYKEGKL